MMKVARQTQPAGGLAGNNFCLEKRRKTQKSLTANRELLDGRVSSVNNFLSKKECDDLIMLATETGWKKSGSSGGGHGRTGREEPRTNSFCIIENQEIADALYERVKPLIAKNLEWVPSSVYFDSEGGAAWTPCGVVERLRFYRYERNEEYPEHMDGSYKRDVYRRNQGENEFTAYTQRSFLTLLIYLSEEFEGGETEFYPDRGHCRFLSDVEYKEPILSIKPKTGTALINLHTIFHKGNGPSSGTTPKYILRTDIVFEKKSSVQAKVPISKKVDKSRTIITTEWEKLFEPSCKLYHD